MDEININKDILFKFSENLLEATLQQRILESITREPLNVIHERVNEAVVKMAQKYHQSIYWICANYVPKITYNSVMAEPSNCFRVTMDVVIEFIPVNVLKNGKGKNTEGCTAGR